MSGHQENWHFSVLGEVQLVLMWWVDKREHRYRTPVTAHTDLSVKNRCRSISFKKILVKEAYVPKELDHFTQVMKSKHFDVETGQPVSMGAKISLFVSLNFPQINHYAIKWALEKH